MFLLNYSLSIKVNETLRKYIGTHRCQEQSYPQLQTASTSSKLYPSKLVQGGVIVGLGCAYLRNVLMDYVCKYSIHIPQVNDVLP